MIERIPELSGASPKPQQQVQRQEVRQEPEEPREPVEDPDTLFSASYARVLFAISEGEIEGLCDRAGNVLETSAELGKGVYVDGTPLINSDGKHNFRGVKVGMTYGTPDQDVILGFGNPAETIYSGSELKAGAGNAVVMPITNPDADNVMVAVRFQSMLTQDKKTGDVHGSEVVYDVWCKLNDDPYVKLQRVRVGGKTRQPYLKTTSHKLPHSPDGETITLTDTWLIKIERVTPDPPTLETANATAVDFITITTRNKFRYPYTALVAAEISARGFSGLPEVGFFQKGIRIRVPANYFPETRGYNRDHLTGDAITDEDGVPIDQPWTGDFYTAWTNNPAWIFFDILTNSRYGVGQYMGVTPTRPEGNVDKWTLYPVARYCDELVDDGQGGVEPRFSCNVYLQAREDAFKVVQDFAGVFRAMLYFSGGSLQAVQDRPKSVFTTFTNANVVDGMFHYEGTGRKARHTVAIVRYNDEGREFKPAFEYVSDPVGIAKYGVRETTVAAFGCTSRGQAHRLGRYILTTELNETGGATFRTGHEGALLRPGCIVAVMDNNRAGAMQGGRLIAIAGDRMTITLDREVAIPAGTVTVLLAKPGAMADPSELTSSTQVGSIQAPQTVELAVVNGASAGTQVVQLDEALPDGITLNAIWVLKTTNIEPQMFRVMGVEEAEPGAYDVSGLIYLESKFGAIENGLNIEEADITDLPENPTEVLPPQNVVLKRVPLITPEGVSLTIAVSWQAPPSALVEAYAVEMRLEPGNWQPVEITKATTSEFRYTVAGTYFVGVTSIATTGARSSTIVAQIVIAQDNPIELYTITGLELVGQGNNTDFVGRDARFEWRLNSPTNESTLSDEQTGDQDPAFQDYEVTVWGVVSGLQVYREITTNPFWVFSYSKNSESSGGPHNQFRVEVRGRDRYGNVTQPASLTVQNPSPQAPSALYVAAAWRVAYLKWNNPQDLDLEAVQVWRSGTAAFADAVLIATVTADAFADNGLEAGTQYWYWLRAVDTFGNLSATYPAGAGFTVVPGRLAATDIDAFALDATRMFSEVIVLKGAVWTNSSPTAGEIAWNAHTLVFHGHEYPIAAGHTANAYVWWRGPLFEPDGTVTTGTAADTTYRTSATHPADGLVPEMGQLNDFMIATNADGAGVVDLAWRGFANAVIGSAWIASLRANKITSGTIDAATINLAPGGTVKSDDFATGSAGWRIDGDGTAEFNDVMVRGTLEASTIKNDSILVARDYPANQLQHVVTMAASNAGWDYEWNLSATNTRLRVGGAWDGSAVVGGSDALRQMHMYSSAVRFVGRGVPDGLYGASKANRVGTSDAQRFVFWFTCQNPGDVAILYRLWDSGDASAPNNDSLTNPWVLTFAAFGNLSTHNAFNGFFTLAIPDFWVIEFAPAPVDSGGSSGGAVDVINDLSLLVQAVNT